MLHAHVICFESIRRSARGFARNATERRQPPNSVRVWRGLVSWISRKTGARSLLMLEVGRFVPRIEFNRTDFYMQIGDSRRAKQTNILGGIQDFGCESSKLSSHRNRFNGRLIFNWPHLNCFFVLSVI